MDISDGALKKWLGFEAKGLHDGLVTKSKSLEKLLKEDKPSCPTRDKKDLEFKKETLQSIARILPVEKHSELMLPINVYVDINVKDQCYIEDSLGAEVIRTLEGFDRAYRYRNGRMWLPMSLAIELVDKYRTILQMVFLV